MDEFETARKAVEESVGPGAVVVDALDPMALLLRQTQAFERIADSLDALHEMLRKFTDEPIRFKGYSSVTGPR